MRQLKKPFRASAIPDMALRRLRSTPSYFFLIWRWSMWLYALIVIVFFKPVYIESPTFKYQNLAALLLTITFIQTLIVTLYAPIFQLFLPRFPQLEKWFGQSKRRRPPAEDEEPDLVPPLVRTRNQYWDVAIYSLDVIICGLVMYYSGPISRPPFGLGSPFYRYGLSTVLAAALAYRYRGGLAAAAGYDLFTLLGIFIPAPGSPQQYMANVIDIAGSLIDAPVAALLSAYIATLLENYARSKRREQENTRRQKALVHVGETLLKGSSDRQELLKRSAAQIRQGGHFHCLVIGLIEHTSDDDNTANHAEIAQPEIAACIEDSLPDYQYPNRHQELLQQVLHSEQTLLTFEPLTTDDGSKRGIARYYLPLHKNGQMQIVMGAESERATPFGERQIEFLAIAGAQLLVALDNIRLAEQMVQLAAHAERGRIAREIHDGIAQLVYMLSLNAETCQAQAYRIAAASEEDAELITPLAERLGKLVTVSKQALWETRTYMFSLKPLMSGTTNLTQMITNQVREFEAISSLPVHLEITGNEERPEGDSRRARRYAQAGTAIFRIVQEALTNAYKHAEANRIQVSLHFGQNTIEVKVADNGRGLHTANDSYDRSQDREQQRIYSGHGMKGMRERAEELGGTFTVSQQQAGGVTVQVCLPL